MHSRKTNRPRSSRLLARASRRTIPTGTALARRPVETRTITRRVTRRLKVEPFPVPLLILANKYDLFKNNERSAARLATSALHLSEPRNARSMKKKVMCQALRFVAHAHGASLLFVSTREKGLQNSVRASACARATRLPGCN